MVTIHARLSLRLVPILLLSGALLLGCAQPAPTTPTPAPAKPAAPSASTPAATAATVPAATKAPAADQADVKFPTKPIELIVPFPAGGAADLMSRALAEASKPYLEHPVVVVNKPGGAAIVGTEAVATAKPDGYTVAALVVGPAATQPHIDKVNYDFNSFDVITMIYDQPLALVVKPESKYQTAKDLLDDAKARPGQLKFAGAPVGGVPHLGCELLLRKAGTKGTIVPYQGTGPAATALLGGHIDAATLPPADVATHVEAGKLRALGVMSSERYASLPNVPTLKEQGIDLSASVWAGVAVPKGTPKPVYDKLHAAFKKGIESSTFQNAAKAAYSPIGYVPPEKFMALWKTDFGRYGELIKTLKQEGVLQ